MVSDTAGVLLAPLAMACAPITGAAPVNAATVMEPSWPAEPSVAVTVALVTGVWA